MLVTRALKTPAEIFKRRRERHQDGFYNRSNHNGELLLWLLFLYRSDKI